jgi:hypothetical protein
MPVKALIHEVLINTAAFFKIAVSLVNRITIQA